MKAFRTWSPVEVWLITLLFRKSSVSAFAQKVLHANWNIACINAPQITPIFIQLPVHFTSAAYGSASLAQKGCKSNLAQSCTFSALQLCCALSSLLARRWPRVAGTRAPHSSCSAVELGHPARSRGGTAYSSPAISSLHVFVYFLDVL